MSANDVMLGGGNATGMFYVAPENTALPAYPGADLSSWTKVGDVSEDGITADLKRSFTALKNWAGKIKRQQPSKDPQEVKVPIMDTTKTVLETVFGNSKVTTVAATSSHGNLIKVDMSNGDTPGGSAFLFIMKDGEDMLMLGTSKGMLREVSDITMAPTDAITWECTIEAASWTFVKDDGQVTS